VVRLQYLTCHG